MISMGSLFTLIGCMIIVVVVSRLAIKNIRSGYTFKNITKEIRKSDVSPPEKKPDVDGGTVKWVINERGTKTGRGDGSEPPSDAGR